MVDRGGFEVGQPDFGAPGGEAFGQFVVNQEGLPRQHLRIGFGAELLRQFAAADRVHLVVIQPHRMQSARRPARKNDRGIENVAYAILEMRTRVDVDMQQRMPLT